MAEDTSNRRTASVRIDPMESKILILASLAMFVYLVLCLSLRSPENDVVNFYYHAENIKAGFLPYRDYVYEFPPLSLIFFTIPGLFTSDLDCYVGLYGLQVILFTLVSLFLVMRLVQKAGYNRILAAFLFMTFILIYFDEMIKKFDMICMAFTLLSVYLFSERRFQWAYVVLAIATLVKIYPGILLPVFLLINIMESNSGGMRVALRGFFCSVITVAVVFLAFAMMSVTPGDILSFMSFHSDRGFQVESTVGVFVQLFAALGMTSVTLVPMYGTFDVMNPICDLLSPYWTYITAVLILSSLYLVIYSLGRNDNLSEYRDYSMFVMLSTGLITMVFMLTNKVFSTQYIIWIYPLLVMMVLVQKNGRVELMSAICVLMVIFSRIFLLDTPGGDMFLVFVILRDVILLIIFVLLIRMIVRYGGLRTKMHVIDG